MSVSGGSVYSGVFKNLTCVGMSVNLIVDTMGEGRLGSFYTELVGVGPAIFDVYLFKIDDGTDYTITLAAEDLPSIDFVVFSDEILLNVILEWLAVGKQMGVVA